MKQALRWDEVKSEALVVSAPGKMEIREVNVPEPANAQVMVAVRHSCISPGTEGRVLAGQQAGLPDFPVVPGYSAAGIVERTGPGSRWKQGQAVFLTGAPCTDYSVCWGAHQRHVVVDDSKLIAVPEGADLAAASSAKLAAIAWHGVRLAKVGEGEKVAVLGLGPIGMCAALSAKARGANVAVMDLRASRRALAQTLGLEVLDPNASDLQGEYAVVIDATGAAAALPGAVTMLRDKPWDDCEHSPTRLVIQGSYAQPPILPYDDLFVKEPLVLIPRDNQRQDIDAVLQMIAKGELPMGNLLQDFGPPSRAMDAYNSLASGERVTGYFTW